MRYPNRRDRRSRPTCCAHSSKAAGSPRKCATKTRSRYAFKAWPLIASCSCLLATAKGLFELEGSAAYNLVVDQNVLAIGTGPECARAQIVYVLAAIDSEVRAGVGGAGVNGLVDLSGRASGCSGHSDRCRRQIACRNAAEGQSEFHWNHTAPHVKHTRPVGIDGLLNLCAVARQYLLHLE